MTCEVCAAATRMESSAVPEDEAYVTVVVRDDDAYGLPKSEYHFCSLEHAQSFFGGTNPEVTDA